MSPIETSRLLGSVVAIVCAAILQTGCGGSGSEPTSESVQTRMRALTATSATTETHAPELPAYLSPQVLGITKAAERRVSRTVFDYDFVVQLKNGPRALSNVQAVVTSLEAGTTVMTAAAHVGELAADASVKSLGKVTIRHDRAHPFSTTALDWSFRGVVTASRDPIVVQRADPAMVRTLSDGKLVVMSQLMAVTDGAQSLEQDLTMFARLGAEVVGRVPEANLYQLLLPKALDEAALVAARDTLGSESHVVAISFNGISETTSSSSYLPNDSFIKQQTNVLTPANVTVAWGTIKDNYNYGQNIKSGRSQLKPSIVVGIIDGGFTRDLAQELKFESLWGPEGGNDWGLNPKLADDGSRTHGMHVAGIIGAIGDNSVDDSHKSQIAGIAWQADPTLKAAKTDGTDAVNFAHIARLARNGARIVNKSMGGKVRADLHADAYIEASFLKNVFRYYDFLLVLSAGNHFDQAIYYQPLANIFQPTGWDEFRNDVASRVLIVANADTVVADKTYHLALAGWNDKDWSDPSKLEKKRTDSTALWCGNCGPTNYGTGVQIAAPGTNILSLSADDDPFFATFPGRPRVLSGTSMAAPFVSGVATVAMSVNPTLSASQLKELLIDPENLGPELSFSKTDIPDLYVKKSLDLAKFRHRLVDMDKVVRKAALTTGKAISYEPPIADTVSINLACHYPDLSSALPTGQYESEGLYRNVRIGAVGDSGIEWLLEDLAEPVLHVVLEPGMYMLQIREGEMGTPWIATDKVYSVYFDLAEPPIAAKVSRLSVSFKAANRAACAVTEDTSDVTVTATDRISLPRFSVEPAALSTDTISSWRINGLASWVQQVVWKFGSGAQDLLVTVYNGASATVDALLSLPGLKEVVAILSDGSGAQEVSLTSKVAVSQGAAVSSFESIGPVIAGIPSTFFLKGTKLPEGLVVKILDCGTAVELAPGGSETQRRFGCTFPASATAGSKEVTVSPVGSKGTPFESAVLAYGLAVNLVKSTVSAVTAAPAPRAGATATVTVTGTNLPSTAFVLVIDATCDRGTVSAKADGTGFTQTCAFGPAPGAKGVTVMSASDASGFLIDDTKTLTVGSASPTSKLPHTGITNQQCYYERWGSNLSSCSNAYALAFSGPGKQDGMYASVNAMSYSAVPKPSGGSYANTECVKDTVTGLMWEGKPANGARGVGDRYTNLGNGAATDTSGYVAAVNTAGLCGYSDWRLPTPDELQMLVNYGRSYPTVDLAWFSNTAGTAYWTSTPNAASPTHAWVVYFDVGYVFNDRLRSNLSAVRLVRASQ